MSAHGYIEAIKAMGLEVIVDADLGSYQGDWVGLVHDTEYSDKDYGFIVVGYGSCGGCDEWEGATGPAERAEIIHRILSTSQWFDSLVDAKVYIASAAANNVGYFVHEDGWADFSRAACEATDA